MILPAMQRTVVHANFHWKLVQRYELFLKDARILEEKSSYLRYFRPFLSLFPIYFLLLQMNTGKCLSGGARATFVGKIIASAIYSEYHETSEISMM